MLSVKEIYVSLQGETSRAGLPCTFVRLAACDLRCSWCDSEYSFAGGDPRTIDEITAEVKALGVRLVTVTGGEPLLQAETRPLISRLCDEGCTVLLETSGAHPIKGIDYRAVIVLDLKAPSSGEMDRNHYENLEHLKATDEVKIVIASEEDYAWAVHTLKTYRLETRAGVLFTWASPPPPGSVELKAMPPAHHRISMRELADRLLADRLPVRFLPQVHKVVWGDVATGK
jgi:7-carboxy-7-deazaguanine synthase